MSEKQNWGAAYWKSIGAEWKSQQPQHLWRLHSDAVNARLLEEWLPGSGVGRLLKTDAFDEAVSDGVGTLLRTRCKKLVAMDLATNTLQAARPNLTKRVVSADARSLPFSSGSFDTIVCLSTLDHFDSERELLAALSELRRVSAPGARLVLTLDNPANPLIWLRGVLPYAWLRRIGLVPYFVGANLGPRRLCDALESIGFAVEERAALVHVPRFAAIAIGGLIPRGARDRVGRPWLRQLMRFERLGEWPTRFVTGHFVAVCARAPSA